MEATLLLFLGWLAGRQVIALDYDQEKQTYIERQTGIAAGDLVRNFLQAVQSEEETERN